MQQLSDKNLYALCKKYGENALHWRRKFIGLLPEVNRRRLYEKKGFASIFEFAKKLCGLSEEQVRLALNLEKRFEDKPALKELLMSGEVSINKLTRVTSVATPKNEGFWAEKVQQLPNRALETLVHDEKIAAKIQKQDGLFEQRFEEKSLHVQKFEELNLAPDILEELFELQRRGIDINQLLREFLERRRQEIAQEKEELAAEQTLGETAQGGGAPSRYIPVSIRRHLEKEHGTLCSIDHCRRPARVIHHAQRFALTASHNPKYLAPLCHEHHAIAHAIDEKVQENKSCSNR